MAQSLPMSCRESLNEHSIHLWSLSFDDPQADSKLLFKQLPLYERDRAERIYSPRLRENFVAGRAFLRSTLSYYLGISPGEVLINIDQRGKPYLAPEINHQNITFNFSHTASLATLVVAHEQRVGVDIEKLKPLQRMAAIAKRFFSKNELDEWHACSEIYRQEKFFRLWTRKEAWTKADGRGLAPLAHHEKPEEWQCSDFTPQKGYVGAIVYEDKQSVIEDKSGF
jgi:4'-phosphopantetheinyl transferase